MRSRYALGTSALDGAVEEDDVVIAAAIPATLTVPAVDVGSSVADAFGGGTAMNDNLGDASHDSGCFDLLRQ